MDDQSTQQPPLEVQPVPSLQRQTFLERHGISPVLFAFVSMILIFVLYQVIGGVVTFVLYGLTPTAANVSGYRLVTGLGQLLLIFIPTLLLVRLISFTPIEFLRLRLPRFQTFVVPIIGVLSLQVMLQIFLIFQDRYLIPDLVRPQLEQLKDLFDELTKLLAGSQSVPELFWVVLIVALIPAVAEEFMFRGLIQRSLQRVMPPVTAAVVTGIIFGAYHFNPFYFVALAALGVYLGFLAYRAGSIWVSVATHFYNNLIACLTLFFNLNDDYVVVGDASEMSLGGLLFTFWLGGIVFLLSTYYFLLITRKDERVG